MRRTERLRFPFATFLLVFLAEVPAVTATEIPARSVPADGRIVLQDYGARDWGPELVHFQVDTGRFVPGKLVLTDAQGKAVPFQIDGATLAFVASVGKGQTVTYTLAASDRDRSAENSTVRVVKTERHVTADITMGNEFLTLRLPNPGPRGYDKKLGQDPPPPFVAWKPAGLEQWIGGARFHTARKFAGVRFTLLRQGPACVEYEARYTFEPAGQYVCRVRVASGMPIVTVTEEFDVGAVTNGEDLLLLELTKGWQPAQISVAAATGEGSTPVQAQAQPFPAYLENKKKSGAASTANVAGFGVPPEPLKPEPGLVLLEKIVPGGKWGGLTGGVQLLGEKAGAPRLGVATLHLGSWRHAMALNTWYKEGTGVIVGLPLSVRLSRWYLDIADDQSPFSTHEHDEGLPFSYGRREWCFYCGDNINTAQPQFGLIGLDRYKEWLVNVPESDDARTSYPRAFFTRKIGERLKKTLDQHPLKAEVGSYYIVSGKTEDAIKQAQRVIQGLKADQTSNWQAQGLTHYRQSQFLAFTNKADDALACPDLPADLRAELRQWLTIWAYLMSEPDIVPRGSGVHHGNNNMTFNRTLALPYFAGLLPDHPHYSYWMEQMKQWTTWKLASQTGYDGPFIEAPSYAVYGPMRYLLSATMILRTTHTVDFSKKPYIPRFLEYFAHLSMPDARFGGKRIIPGMGNSCNLSERLWGISLAVLEPEQKDEAGFFKFMQRLAQGNELGKRGEESETGYPLWYLPDIAEKPRELQTTFLPTYGVIFRAHFNQPDETAMLFRAGINWSHWDTDTLNTILYSKGAPLSPGTGYQYYSGAATENNSMYHNGCKVEKRDLPDLFGRVDTGVIDYGFSDAADYARGDRYHPGGLFEDGKPTVWRRHIVFVKGEKADGPNYFVLRDTFPGGEHRNKWWNWLNLGKADMVEVKGADVAGASRPCQDLELKTTFGAGTRVWFSRPHEIKPRLTFDAGRHDGLPGGPEIKTIVEAAAKAGEDFFYVVYPHKDGEAVPLFERLGHGCIKIATSESTDYVFASDAPVTFEQDGVVFEGKAGAVRVFKDRVTLSLLSTAGTDSQFPNGRKLVSVPAPAGRIGYKGAIFAGHGPFQRTVPLAELKAKTSSVSDTYEKQWLSVDLGGVTLEGEGPFEARLDGQTVTIKTKGRPRVLRMTRPAWMLRPQLWIDGEEFMACWTDYPGSNWGRLDHTNIVALTVPDGSHELVVKNMVFPPLWKRPFTPAIEGVAK